MNLSLLLGALSNVVSSSHSFAVTFAVRSVVLLNVLEHVLEGNRLFTVVADGDGTGGFDLPGIAFSVVLAVSEPFTESLLLLNGDEGNVGVLGKSGHSALVLGVVAVLGKNAEESLFAIK